MIDRLYKVYCYWRIHGSAALRQLIIYKLTHKPQHFTDPMLESMPDNNRAINAAQISQSRFQAGHAAAQLFFAHVIDSSRQYRH